MILLSNILFFLIDGLRSDVCFNEKKTIIKVIKEAKDLHISKEIFIVDNCSTDGTREILDSLNDGVDFDFSSIQVNNININNSGNDCIDFSKGSYKINNVSFIHGDALNNLANNKQYNVIAVTASMPLYNDIFETLLTEGGKIFM